MFNFDIRLPILKCIMMYLTYTDLLFFFLIIIYCIYKPIYTIMTIIRVRLCHLQIVLRYSIPQV